MARLGSEARNRRDVTLLREGLLSILSSLSSLKGKRRESSSDEDRELLFHDGRNWPSSRGILAGGVDSCISAELWMAGKIWGAAAGSLGDASCEKRGKATAFVL